MEEEEQIEIQEEITNNNVILENNAQTNRPEQTTTLEDIIQTIIINYQSQNGNNLITQQTFFEDILSNISIDVNTQQELQKQINLIFQNKNAIPISELTQHFFGEDITQEQQTQSSNQQNTNTHKVNISELNLLDQDIPKELIDVQKPFINKETTKQQETNYVELNNDNNNRGVILDNQNDIYDNNEMTYESLIKPSNNFGKLYEEENIESENEHENEEDNGEENNDIEQDSNNPQIENNNNIDDISDNKDYVEDPLIYTINQKKKSFLEKRNENISSSLNQAKELRNNNIENDFFMFVFQHEVNNKKKLKFINDKVNKLYDSDSNKKHLYSTSLRNMGQSSHNTNLNLTTPTSFLSYKVTKSSGYQRQPNTKLSVERDKIFNEILQNAKQQSSLISHRKKHNKKQTDKFNNYISSIEDKVPSLSCVYIDLFTQIYPLMFNNENSNQVINLLKSMIYNKDIELNKTISNVINYCQNISTVTIEHSKNKDKKKLKHELQIQNKENDNNTQKATFSLGNSNEHYIKRTKNNTMCEFNINKTLRSFSKESSNIMRGGRTILPPMNINGNSCSNKESKKLVLFDCGKGSKTKRRGYEDSGFTIKNNSTIIKGEYLGNNNNGWNSNNNGGIDNITYSNFYSLKALNYKTKLIVGDNHINNNNNSNHERKGLSPLVGNEYLPKSCKGKSTKNVTFRNMFKFSLNRSEGNNHTNFMSGGLHFYGEQKYNHNGNSNSNNIATKINTKM